MEKCFVCGKKIRFIHRKKDGKKVTVNPTPLRFIPPNGFDKEELFINDTGIEVKGCRAPDGMLGYKKHEC